MHMRLKATWENVENEFQRKNTHNWKVPFINCNWGKLSKIDMILISTSDTDGLLKVMYSSLKFQWTASSSIETFCLQCNFGLNCDSASLAEEDCILTLK